MAEEKDLGFKVSDHRMFNPDGTPRERSDDPAARESSEPREQSKDISEPQGESGKVISFPGDPRKPAEAGDRAQAGGKSEQAAGARPWAEAQAGVGEAPSELPAASFAGLVNMLAVEAVMHLGLVENPFGGGITVDLEAARHVIDMLGILEEKTRGNLSRDEADLIETVLGDLRMQFVAISKRR